MASHSYYILIALVALFFPLQGFSSGPTCKSMTNLNELASEVEVNLFKSWLQNVGSHTQSEKLKRFVQGPIAYKLREQQAIRWRISDKYFINTQEGLTNSFYTRSEKFDFFGGASVKEVDGLKTLAFNILSIKVSEKNRILEYEEHTSGLNRNMAKAIATIFSEIYNITNQHPNIEQVQISALLIINPALNQMLKSYGFKKTERSTQYEEMNELDSGRSWILSFPVNSQAVF